MAGNFRNPISKENVMLFLYLDIDGVAIPDRQADQSITFAMSNRLRRILDRTGAKLVISSHRRISKLTVLNLLSAAGFTRHDFADDWCTPFLLSPSPNTSVRGQEIDQHLVHNRPAGFVILDDGPVLPSQAKNFVQTDPSKGLTDDDADKAIAILKGPCLCARSQSNLGYGRRGSHNDR